MVSNSIVQGHYDEPLRAKIVSAKASTIFEFHLHCTISELNTIFLIPVAGFTVLERRFLQGWTDNRLRRFR